LEELIRDCANCALRPGVLSYAAVLHHGLSCTAVAQHVGLSRRSISRAITRAQMGGLTDIIPKAASAPPTTPP